jgi:hypothetical protein
MVGVGKETEGRKGEAEREHSHSHAWVLSLFFSVLCDGFVVLGSHTHTHTQTLPHTAWDVQEMRHVLSGASVYVDSLYST